MRNPLAKGETMTKHAGIESLEVWQAGREFAVRVCKQAIPKLPDSEKYSLAEQLRRAAQSVPGNIAEAYGRYHFADATRYCYIARGSLEETWSHLVLARDLGYLDSDEYEEYRSDYVRVLQLVNGYIRYLRRSRKDGR